MAQKPAYPPARNVNRRSGGEQARDSWAGGNEIGNGIKGHIGTGIQVGNRRMIKIGARIEGRNEIGSMEGRVCLGLGAHSISIECGAAELRANASRT
ncbi:hypothetical protein EVAR_5368_1 [Eumeta japonica]|uniref:Uncharacterized protein n=1 Tax=Eumeta variegata TaxID=151549 RepID=A0A4C1TNY9_EUMVA|nr:hypothetical protein EVAR_5368_1 [Eumeta japonica]